MKIVYQGRPEDTDAGNVKTLLEGKGVDLARAVVEFNGEAYGGNADFSALRLAEADEVNVFHIVAGG